MEHGGKHSVLGVLVDSIDYEHAVDQILQAARQGRPFSVSALAVHGVMTGVADPEHRYRLNHFDLICPDGQPVRWALNLLHNQSLSERVYGPRLMLEVCRNAAQNNIPIYLYGSTEDTLAALQENLCRRFSGLVIAGARPSKFRTLAPEETQRIVQEIQHSQARIVFVGLGCPRQEVFTYELCEELSMPTIAVGAAFSFHAGLLAQAPAWMQGVGLEWAFRLIKEPKRLWRRYLTLNPKYAMLLLAQAFGWREFNSRGQQPKRKIRYG